MEIRSDSADSEVRKKSRIHGKVIEKTKIRVPVEKKNLSFTTHVRVKKPVQN